MTMLAIIVHYVLFQKSENGNRRNKQAMFIHTTYIYMYMYMYIKESEDL